MTLNEPEWRSKFLTTCRIAQPVRQLSSLIVSQFCSACKADTCRRQELSVLGWKYAALADRGWVPEMDNAGRRLIAYEKVINCAERSPTQRWRDGRCSLSAAPLASCFLVAGLPLPVCFEMPTASSIDDYRRSLLVSCRNGHVSRRIPTQYCWRLVF